MGDGRWCDGQRSNAITVTLEDEKHLRNSFWFDLIFFFLFLFDLVYTWLYRRCGDCASFITDQKMPSDAKKKHRREPIQTNVRTKMAKILRTSNVRRKWIAMQLRAVTKPNKQSEKGNVRCVYELLSEHFANEYHKTNVRSVWIGWIFRQQTLNDLQWSRIGDFIWKFFRSLSLSFALNFSIVYVSWRVSAPSMLFWFIAMRPRERLCWLCECERWQAVCRFVCVWAHSAVAPRFYTTEKTDLTQRMC